MEIGRFGGLLYSSNAQHKGISNLKEFVSCGIKNLSVYHAYLDAIQLEICQRSQEFLSIIFLDEE